MFEIAEYTILSNQINQVLKGKIVHTGNLGNSPHKFVWHNCENEEFAARIADKVVGESFVRGRWLFIPLEPGFILLLGECGGKLLYHDPGVKQPAKYHLYVEFKDGSFLTETTQMWGAMELYEGDKVWEREYIKNMRLTPLDNDFSFEYFNQLFNKVTENKKYSAKALLTQEQLIPGLGNACAQDILFKAGLHPKHDIAELDSSARKSFYHAIIDTVQTIIAGGGRYDEVDLIGQPGRYIRLMDKNAAGRPCPRCGTVVKKIYYLGGACYFCPSCQT
jgi:formamidopyrimidine-DNA glycosylase